MADTIPTTRQPVVEKSPDGLSFLFTVPWYRFLGALSQSNQAPSAVTVGASPFSYTAPQAGIVIVTGGTVSAISYGRGGVFTNTGLITGVIPVSQGDVIRVTYTVLPTMTFVRR